MKPKYNICELQICPFDIIDTKKGRYFKADRNNFPYRLCVFDEESKRVIDVKTETSYEYIEMSLMYFIGNEAKRIEPGKRYAILPLNVNFKKYSNKDYKKAQDIIRRLTSGEEFVDGNITSNEDYLNLINSNEQTVKEKIKRK